MHLTEEQHHVVEAAGGRPVEVIDPCSQRRYVLVPAEQYHRADPGGPAENAPRSGLPPEVARGEPMRFKLRELPMPPEAAAEVRQWCRQLGLWRRRSVQEIEDEAKLSYYFGGRYVAYLKSKAGPIVVAAGRQASDAYQRQLDALTSEERRQVVSWVPPVWNDPASELLTPFDSHDH